jgi:hypothetical protein
MYGWIRELVNAERMSYLDDRPLSDRGYDFPECRVREESPWLFRSSEESESGGRSMKVEEVSKDCLYILFDMRVIIAGGCFQNCEYESLTLCPGIYMPYSIAVPRRGSDSTNAIASQHSAVRSRPGPQPPARFHKGLSTAFTHKKGKISIMTFDSV